jgi:hypothetical protein
MTRVEPNVAVEDPRVEGNTRLTAATGAVLFVLLAIEGVTILSTGRLLTWHAFFGVMLIPLVALKLFSTGVRFLAYYRGDAAYVAKGPPHIVLRVLGPFVSLLTVIVLASGVILIVEGHRGPWFTVHKASFILWFGAMTVHVLGHIIETVRIAPLDWRPGAALQRATVRRAALVAAIVLGILGGIAIQSSVHSWHGHKDGAPVVRAIAPR